VFRHVNGLQASARALLPSPDTARTPKKQILTELKGRSSSTCDRSSVTHHAWLVRDAARSSREGTVRSKKSRERKNSGKHLFRSLLLGAAMMAAALSGCMTKEKVDELMYAHNHQKMVMVISSESENGDDDED
jgi:hypothetical protein